MLESKYFNDFPHLFGGRFRPATHQVNLVDYPALEVAQSYSNWVAAIRSPRGEHMYFSTLEALNLPLSEALLHLEPISDDCLRKYLVVQSVQGNWCGIFGNFFTGGGGMNVLTYACKTFGVNGVSVGVTPDSENPVTHRGLLAACRFWFWSNQVDWGNGPSHRVHVIDEGSRKPRWRFDHSDLYLPCEDTEGYKARRILDRFNPQKMLDYLAQLGLFPYDETFYTSEAYVIGQTYASGPPPRVRETFEQAQQRLGIIH